MCFTVSSAPAPVTRDHVAPTTPRNAADCQPAHERPVDGAAPRVHAAADRLEDHRGEHVVRDRRQRVDIEEDHEHGRHQRAAAHAGETDHEPDDQRRRRCSVASFPPAAAVKTSAAAFPTGLVDKLGQTGTAGQGAPPGAMGEWARIAGMRITAKADYAVRAAAELAAAADDGVLVKGEQLARSQSIPQNFLENILTELRRAGIVRTRRGAEGGYQLARPAADITVADVLRAVEGPLAAVQGKPPGVTAVHRRGRAPPRRVDRATRQPAIGARARDARRPRQRKAPRRGEGANPRQRLLARPLTSPRPCPRFLANQ